MAEPLSDAALEQYDHWAAMLRQALASNDLQEQLHGLGRWAFGLAYDAVPDLVAEVRRLRAELEHRFCTACAMDDPAHCEERPTTPCRSATIWRGALSTPSAGAPDG